MGTLIERLVALEALPTEPTMLNRVGAALVKGAVFTTLGTANAAIKRQDGMLTYTDSDGITWVHYLPNGALVETEETALPEVSPALMQRVGERLALRELTNPQALFMGKSLLALAEKGYWFDGRKWQKSKKTAEVE